MLDNSKPIPGCDYRKVEVIIEKDLCLSRYLGKKTVDVQRRSGSSTTHSAELIALVNAMHAAGLAAQGYPKTATLGFAMRFFTKKPSDAPPVMTVQETQPAPIVETPKPVSVAKPVPEVKKVDPPRRVARTEEKAGFCASVALANLSMSMLQLAEQYDTSPGYDKRRDKLNALATEYEKQAKDFLEECWDTAKKHAKA